MFLINGKPGESISIQDRGLHYGDGVFETIAASEGNLLCWDKHYERLKRGCKRLNLVCPDKTLLLDEARQLLTETKAVIKIIVTRGAGGRGYNPHGNPEPTRIIASYDWPDYPGYIVTDGIKAKICNLRMSINPELAGIKHLNRLEQVIARGEWTDTDISEGLMMDQDDNIIEGTMSNVFIISGSNLITPDLSRCGIHGVIRQCIIELVPELDIKIKISDLKIEDVSKADEVFVCNSTFGIWPVREIDGQKINTGPYAKKIREMLIKKGLICG